MWRVTESNFSIRASTLTRCFNNLDPNFAVKSLYPKGRAGQFLKPFLRFERCVLFGPLTSESPAPWNFVILPGRLFRRSVSHPATFGSVIANHVTASRLFVPLPSSSILDFFFSSRCSYLEFCWKPSLGALRFTATSDILADRSPFPSSSINRKRFLLFREISNCI